MKRPLVLFTAGLLACTSNVVDEGGGDTSGSSSSGSTPASSTTSTSTPSETTGGLPPMTSSESTAGSGDSTTSSIAWETEGADEGYATTGGCGFTCPQPGGGGGPGGGSLECSISIQDCSEGEKCAPWANDGGWIWNATRCVPIEASPDDLDEPCEFEGAYVSGIDTCDAGQWCGPEAAGEQEKNVGVCHQLCGAGPCLPGTQCVVPGAGEIGVCQEPCDPLGDPCPASQACMPAGFGFVCHLADPKPEPDTCAFPSECAPGTVCIEAPQCDDGETCCVPYCDLDTPDCADGQTCVDYGSPLPDYENVGYCAG